MLIEQKLRIKLAEFYDYELSSNFLEKYEKELRHPLSI